MNRRWIQRFLPLMVGLLCGLPLRAWAGTPPAQMLPSALLVFPLIEVQGNGDTRIEVVNLSGNPQLVQCFYVEGNSCNEVGFFLSLTPYQPIAWLASTGLSNTSSGSAVPPFYGDGEMKCAVVPPRPEISYHNTIQGRATIFQSSGSTVSYSAVGFQRLSDGDFTGTIALNGTTYAQCPDKLHFDVLADQPGSTSEMILIPCTEDLLFQQPTSLGVQVLVTNEFEQTFSASINLTCFERSTLGGITDSLNRATLGSDTAQVVVRGTTGPLLGLVIDQVPGAGTAGNEPSFEGGRSATVVFP